MLQAAAPPEQPAVAVPAEPSTAVSAGTRQSGGVLVVRVSSTRSAGSESSQITPR